MYKGRINLWLSILVGILIYNVLSNISFNPFKTYEVKVNVETVYDEALSSQMNTSQIDDYDLISVGLDSNPDIIFTDKMDEIDGYTKSLSLSSPLVLYTLGGDSDGFVNLSKESSSYPVLKVDLFSILNAIESDKTWQDLGFAKEVLKGKVVLTIPNESNSYYSNVVDLFYATLNGGKMPDSERMMELKDRVVNILSKCNKVKDIRQVLIENVDENSKNTIACIGPEYLFLRGSTSIFAPNSSSAYRFSYFDHTSFLTCNVYTKNKVLDENNKVVEASIGEEFVNFMKDEYYFMDRYGWRIPSSNYSVTNCSYILLPTVNEIIY